MREEMSQVWGEGLTPDQESAITALLSEPTISKAAESIGISDRSIYRWLKEDPFQRAYREARREAFRHAVSLTQKYAPVAVQTLLKIMTDASAGHAAKVSAASAFLKFSRESIELDELAERIEKLESVTSEQDRDSFR